MYSQGLTSLESEYMVPRHQIAPAGYHSGRLYEWMSPEMGNFMPPRALPGISTAQEKTLDDG